MEQIREDNICNYYILPFLRMNKFSFGNFNFVNSYLSEDRNQIIVEVEDFELLPLNYHKHEHYINDYNENNRVFIVYDVPSEFKEEVELFCIGKYSQYKQEAKERIYQFSGLAYKNEKKGKTITDQRLMVLSRNPALRKTMEKRYGVNIPEDAELASTPLPSNFIENEKHIDAYNRDLGSKIGEENESFSKS